MRAILVGCALTAAAHAEPAPDLQLKHEPPPRHLRMRPRAAAAAPAPAPKPSPLVTPARDTGPEAVLVRDVNDRISARFAIGYAVDGTALTGKPALSGNLPNQDPARPDFSLIHAYGFGEGSLSTRGVGLESLSTYVGARLVLANHDVITNPDTSPTSQVARPAPIATWFDRTGLTSYSAWGELSDFLPWHKLAPLRVRAGELYVYGPWVAHIFGALAAWESKLIHAEAYAGSRVPDYTLAVADQDLDRSLIAGASGRLDLREAGHPIPLVVGLQTLTFTRVASGMNVPSSHQEGELDWRPRKDVALIGQARLLDGALANEHVQLRARYSEVTNLVFDFTHRHSDDWRWDPSLVGPTASDPLAPKRYLDLGPVLPQFLFSARAGTLIAENVDLYGRFAASAIDSRQTSAFAADYIEGGGALELRLRRTIAVGISGVNRETRRSTSIQPIYDIPGVAQPLPDPAMLGEKGFTEAGATLRMSLGARTFSALVELYGRYTRYPNTYCIADANAMACASQTMTGIPDSDLRIGGRVQIEAWIRKRLRLFAAYDLSNRYAFAPDITGYKSLRLIMEGFY